MVRTYLFLRGCGLAEDKIRYARSLRNELSARVPTCCCALLLARCPACSFRQHLSDEMAHYAKDCWDAEINNSYVRSASSTCSSATCFADLGCPCSALCYLGLD